MKGEIPGRGALCIPVHAESAPSDPDALIARVAAQQYGVISLRQLERLGIHRQGRATRTLTRRLHPIHRGVYAVGHPGLSIEGRWMAAVLACGEGAVLSHISAARLWRLLPQPRPALEMESPSPIHVAIPLRSGRRNRRGIVIHRPRALHARDITRRQNIPVTTPSRTLRDLRRSVPQPQFARALRQAEYLGLPIGDGLEPDHTRSELEARFLALCRRHRLPMPEVNVRMGPHLVDFLWRDARLVVELDGYGAHGGRQAFESDRARDAELKLLGYDVVRFTWRQLTAERTRVVATLRGLLRSGAQ